MRFTPVLFVAATLLGLLVPGARAQETIETNSGSTYQGTVVSNDGTSVEIKTTDGKTMKLPYESLTPMTQYRLQRAAAPVDGPGQLALAEWCVEKKVYDMAKVHYRKAAEVAPEMMDQIKASVVVARKTAADELLARAKTLQAAGKPQEARESLSLIVQELPLEDAAKEASRMLADETTQRKDSALKRPAKAKAAKGADDRPIPPRENGEAFSDAAVALFQPLIDSYRKMLDYTQEGLAESGSSGTKEYEKALKEGEKIRKAADKLRPQGATDPEIAEALALADSKLEEAIVDARINLVHDYLLRSSYNDASETVNKGLADYPKNARLLSTRSEVASAAAENSGGDWVIGGRLR